MSNAAAPAGVAAFLFTDIEGSSLKWLNHRAVMQAALAAHDEILRLAIADRSGQVFKTAGDAFYAAFQHPADAVNAAIAGQRALEAHDFAEVGGMKVRMAVHFGSAETRDGDYFGPALNRCARLLALGHGGQILVTSSMAELIASERDVKASLVPLGAHPLDDPMQPVAVLQVVAEGLPKDFPPLRRTAARATNLPHQLTRLIGRDTELNALRALIADHRLVTLTGSGGVGKTRLAIAAAAEQFSNFSGGAWVTELAPLRDPSAVASSVATSLGFGLDHNERAGGYEAGVWLTELAPLNDPSLVASSIAATLGIELSDDTTPAEVLAKRLRDQDVLLILDNCEHVIEAVARLSETLLAQCPGVHIIATSQEPLDIGGEVVLRLQTLAAPASASPSAVEAMGFAAVVLFVERAKAVDARFALTDQNAPAVAAICRRLDGIALAIEMAAARVPVLGVVALSQRLDQWFRLLTGGRRTALPRQQTLRATLDWSHDLLDMRERVVLRRLSVFAGGFTLAAAAAVASDETLDEIDVDDAVALLTQKSLVAVDPVEGRHRYHLMETTRDYVRAKLVEAGEESRLSRAHAEQVSCEMQRGYETALRRSDAELREDLGAELDNVRTAVDWAFGDGGDPATGLALMGAAWPMFQALALLSEARLRLEAAAARIADSTPPEDAARIWDALGGAWGFAHPVRAFDAYGRAAALLRRGGDPVRLGSALVMMGRLAQVIADHADRSQGLLEEAGALIARSDVPRLRGQLSRGRANAAANAGDYRTAVALMREALKAFVDAGSDMASAVETSLAYMLWASGQIEDAIAVCHGVAARIRDDRFPNAPNLGFVLGNLAGLLTERGDVAAARTCLSEAVPLLRDPWQLWVILDHVALLHAKTGLYEASAQATGAANAAYAARRALRQVNERRAHEAAETVLAQYLDPAGIQILLGEGVRLGENDIASLALSGQPPG
jgi:predicted ATPase/class 3 adenylate cyclase